MKYVRLKRRDPKHGIVLKQYVYRGIRFLETGGWYVVDDEVATYLKEHARQKATDPRSLEAFDICTETEARSIDERENTESQPRRPADNARATKARGLTSDDLRPVKKKGRPKKKKESKPNTEKSLEKEKPSKSSNNEIVEAESKETRPTEKEGE
jgi:hypothetical protein